MEQIRIKDGINLYVIKDDKFKTYTAAVFLHMPLARESATKNALLPSVLKRGSKSFSDQKAIFEALEMLYGASLSEGVQKRGEDQVLSFYLEGVADAFIPTGESALSLGLELLFDIIFNTKDEFLQSAVDGEKKNLKDRIENMINDKRQYAVRRCFELSCENEAYAVCEHGYVKDLDAIDQKSLRAHYDAVIESSPIDIFLCGNLDTETVVPLIEKLLEPISPRNTKRPKTVQATPSALPDTAEEMDVAQGKLSVSYTTSTPADSEDYPTLLVYNSIFGGGAHSKLFNNVREKLSLAYYASSQAERLKGMIMVSAGIEFSNYQKALSEIELQKKAIEDGQITDDEFNASVKSLTNSLRSYKDSTAHRIAFYLGQVLAGTGDDPETVAKKIERVTKDDVIKFSKKVDKKLVYFLKGVGA